LTPNIQRAAYHTRSKEQLRLVA